MALMDSFLYFLPIVTALAVTALRCSELSTKRDLVPGHILEKTTFRLFVTCGFVVLFVALGEYIVRGKTLAPVPYGIGLALAIASFVIRRAAIAALGRYWSLHVEIRESHQLVTSGPFRWMRHPTYLSMIFELLAGLFLLNSYYAGVVILGFFVPILILRVRIEEKALIEKFGDQYRDYIRSTPSIFPWKFPRN